MKQKRPIMCSDIYRMPVLKLFSIIKLLKHVSKLNRNIIRSQKNLWLVTSGWSFVPTKISETICYFQLVTQGYSFTVFFNAALLAILSSASESRLTWYFASRQSYTWLVYMALFIRWYTHSVVAMVMCKTGYVWPTTEFRDSPEYAAQRMKIFSRYENTMDCQRRALFVNR